MDSPHDEIEVHWPDEPDEFKLRSDERLFWRLSEVEDLLGSNVPVPEEFKDYKAEEGAFLDVREIIEAVEEGPELESRVTLSDAFERVRALVSGKDSLVPPDVYDRLRHATAKVVSSVAVVPSERPWVFLAIGAYDRTVPRWALVNLDHDAKTKLFSSLDQVAEEVRSRLAPGPEDKSFDKEASDLLTKAVQMVEREHRALLPRRKQRALEELAYLLNQWLPEAKASGDQRRVALISNILRALEPPQRDPAVDLEPIAEWWLAVIRPDWYHYLANRGSKQPARLRGLRRRLKQEPISTERMQGFESLPLAATPLDRRVVAAIVGVPAN
jgi:hypothetical protein